MDLNKTSPTVSRIGTPPRSFLGAVTAFRNAEYAAALWNLQNATDLKSLILKSRVLHRIGLSATALELLSSLNKAVELAPSHLKIEYYVADSLASCECEELDRARAALDQCRRSAFNTQDALCEVKYYIAESRFSHFVGDPKASSDYAYDALDASVNCERGMARSQDYRASFLEGRSRAYGHLALSATLKANFNDAKHFLTLAMQELYSASYRDLDLYAVLLAHVAILARDFPTNVPDEFWRKSLSEIAAWPSRLSYVGFEILRSLAWISERQGEEVAALTYWRRATNATELPCYRILGLIEKASLSRELGEMRNAQEELEFAESLAEDVDWTALGQERIALAVLAQGLAPISPEKAKRHYNRYQRCSTVKLPSISPIDLRPRGHELIAEATVNRYCGEKDAAIAMFLEAFELWVAQGYETNATRAALHLAELTGGERFVEFVRRQAQSHDIGWLSQRSMRLDQALHNRAS